MPGIGLLGTKKEVTSGGGCGAVSLYFPEVLCENVPKEAEKYSLVECEDRSVVRYCATFRDIEVCLYGVNIEDLVELPSGSDKSWKLQGFAKPVEGGVPIHFNVISATGEGVPSLLTGGEMLFEMGEALVAFNSQNVLESLRKEVLQEQGREGSWPTTDRNTMSNNPDPRRKKSEGSTMKEPAMLEVGGLGV